MDETIGLTGKALLAHQASKKIEDGMRMFEEGRLELLNLFPDPDKRSSVANRMLRDPGNFKMSTKTDAELIKVILKMLKDGEKVTTHLLRKKLSITNSHVSRLREKLRDRVIDKAVPNSGNARTWILASKTKTASDNSSESLDPERVQRVLDLLRTDDWYTMKKLQTTMAMDWYLLDKIVQHLVNRGLAKSVRKANNPAHKNLRCYKREFVYWTAV